MPPRPGSWARRSRADEITALSRSACSIASLLCAAPANTRQTAARSTARSTPAETARRRGLRGARPRCHAGDATRPGRAARTRPGYRWPGAERCSCANPHFCVLASFHAVSMQAKPHAVFFEYFLAENRVVTEIDPQPVGRPHVGFEIERAADHRGDAVEARARVETRLSQLVGRHPRGLKTGIIEPVLRMQPPLAVIQQPALRLEFAV